MEQNLEELKSFISAEIQRSSNISEARTFFKFFHLGDIITIITAVILIAITWGKMQSDLEVVRRDVAKNAEILDSNEGTPGANRRISLIELQQRLLERELAENVDKCEDTRSESMRALERFEIKLDKHMAGE